MPTRDTAPIGAPCWSDLMTADTERSREFYCQLFGWTADEPNEDFGGYFSFLRDGAPIAGGMARPPDYQGPDVWSIYLATDDTRKTVDAATASGGQIIVPAMDIADLGTMAVITEPGGAATGLWQAGLHKGFGVLGEPGAPAWFELQTRDFPATVPFFRELFGLEAHVLQDTPEFRYTILKRGETWLAGVTDASNSLPEGVPSHWAVIFGVQDTDAALSKITELGGSVVRPAEDTPYGRLAAAVDPTGAHFRLAGPNAAGTASG